MISRGFGSASRQQPVEKGHQKSEDDPGDDLGGGMPQHFLQPLFRNWFPSKNLINQQVDALGLQTSLAAHPGCIIDHDHANGQRQGK